jgi:hypothetical protein
MTTIASASFIASYQTTVVFGRSLTSSELGQTAAVRTTALTAGRQCSTSTVNADGLSTAYWTSADDANSYATTVNAFSPAPETACTVTAV